MAEMIDVTVKVPQDRVGDFHVFFGEWLQGLLTQTSPLRQEWSIDDADLAGRVWDRLPANAAKLLGLLIQRREMAGASLVEELGMRDVSQIVGLNGWVGRICNEVGRKSPIKASPGENGTVWSVDPRIRNLFADVRRGR